MTRTGVLICGHGSRDPEAVAEFAAAAAALRPRLGDVAFAAGHLEFAEPTIGGGLALLAAQGARRILAVPAMLFAASHVGRDLPRELASFGAAHPGIALHLGRGLGVEAGLLAAAADRVAAACGTAVARADTLLVVVGRGTGDAAANATIADLAFRLRADGGFGGAEIAFSGMAPPPVAAALERAGGAGFRRIVVFPYFLFTGVLVKRIHAEAEAAARRFPAVAFVTAGHLGAHPAVLDAIAGRVAELADRCD